MTQDPKPNNSSSKIGQSITGAEALLESLILENVEVIFGYPGGAIMPVYDALYDYADKIRHILVRHEQGASHSAEGYARVKRKPGVCMATSGPGATNLVTGIADAMIDSVPMVCITGQVHKNLLGTDAFQETDILGITFPITKWSYQITKPEEIPYIISKAFNVAMQGRPGPVVIDITKNAQVEKAIYEPKKYEGLNKPQVEPALNITDVKIAAEIINKAKRPFILAGHGVLISKASELLRELSEKADIPVASTLHGLSVLSAEHPNYVGMLGMHGNYAPNILTNKADVIIAIGMRFDDRVTGDVTRYAPKAKIIHIEIDPAEINKIIPADVPIISDAKKALTALLPDINIANHAGWKKEFALLKEQESKIVFNNDLKPKGEKLRMGEVIRMLSEKTNGQATLVADVGQHQMIAARYYDYNTKDSWISSGGLGTMGFALPAAIGAKVADPSREVIAVIGDGGVQMTIQELGTIMQEKIPVKIMVLNNSFLGMVRQWQELFFDKRYSFTEMHNPNFIKLAEAYSIPGSTVSSREGLPAALDAMLKTDGPYFLEVIVEQEGNVFPMIPAGASVSDCRLE